MIAIANGANWRKKVQSFEDDEAVDFLDKLHEESKSYWKVHNNPELLAKYKPDLIPANRITYFTEAHYALEANVIKICEQVASDHGVHVRVRCFDGLMVDFNSDYTDLMRAMEERG